MKTPPTKPAKSPDSRVPQQRSPMMQVLYRRAAVQLRKQSKQQKSGAGSPKLETDPRRIFHELQVHQVELEMQNAELRKTRDELEVALENYTDLYDFAPVGYFTLAPNGVIQQVNLTGAILAGIERSRLAGRSFGQLIAAGLRPAFGSFLQQVFAGPAKQSGEFELVCQGQPPRVVNIEAQRLLDGQKCRAVVVDITARQMVEDLVRVSEIRYRRLFEAAHDGVLILDPGTRKITDANPFMTKLLGYSHNQLVGKELFEIGLLKDEVASREAFQKLKRQKEVRYENLPLESRHGRHQEVEVVANLYQESGRPVIQCNIRDITERKAAEEALRASEERYRTLFDLGPVAVYSCDRSGLIQEFNRRAMELWGREPVSGNLRERFCGSFKMLLPDGSVLPRAQCPMAGVVSGKIPAVRDAEVIIERPDGSRITVVVNIRPLKNTRGEITGAINCFYDITERKAAEEAQRRIDVLAASNRKLEQAIVRRQAVEESLRKSEQHQKVLLEQSHTMQEQLRQLSRQILSAQETERREISRELHDVIAQTLTGINVRLAALKREAAINLKGLDRNIARTQRLVEKSVNIVHQFARELRPTVLDDLGLIPALHAFVTAFSKRTRLHVHLKVFAGLKQLDIPGRTALFRVAQEALTNVARHAKASRVELSIQKFHQAIRMEIKDDGKSFDVERTLNTRGTKRLGLLGMRERVEMMGGVFGVESAPGRGTTIRVEIPFARKSRPEKSGQKAPGNI